MSRYERPVTPAEFSSGLQALVEQIVPGGKPIYVDVHPIEGALANECFPLVESQVGENGGQAITGWSLWELPSLYVEAEFHCIWQQPSGELVDIAPKKHPTARVLFLADPHSKYEGKQVNNVRKALRADHSLIAFLDTFDAEFELVNRAERADMHTVTLQGKEAEEYHAIQEQRAYLSLQLMQILPLNGPYQPCPCGSGKKVKWCHKMMATP